MNIITVSSGFGVTHKRPYVQIVWENQVAQFTPDEARQHALSILECADAAEGDAFIFNFVKDKIGVDDNAAGAVLVDFRNFRIKEKGGDG